MYLIDKSLMPTVVTPEAFTLESLIAWLETMPAEQVYVSDDVRNCMICQYGAAHGAGNTYHTLSDRFDSAGHHEVKTTVALSRPHTFGAALTRAREYARAKS